jgi:copper transport protein
MAGGRSQSDPVKRALRAAGVVTLAAVLAVIGMLASPAAGHSLLKRSSPAAGSSLAHSPRVLQLSFTEPPELNLSTISVLDSSGQAVPGVGTAAAVPGNPDELQSALPRLADGVYTVNWRTTSKVDGHTTAGSFAFGIGVRPSGAAPGGNPPSGGGNPPPASVAGLWLLYWGLALLVASGATGVLVFRWQLPPGARLVIAAGWLLAAAGVSTMTLAEQSTVGVSFAVLFHTASGRDLLAQAAAVLVCGVAALFAALRPAGPRLAVVGVVAACALFVHAQAGHADAASPVRLLNVADQWVHMLAAAIWVGGLVWMLLGLRGLAGAARASAVGRFSQLALASVVVLAVTGVLRAVPEVGGIDALVATSFGIVLLIKAGLFATLMALAWRNRYLLVPLIRAGSRHPTSPPEQNDSTVVAALRRSVTLEVTLAAVVLIAAAVLSSLPPASYVEAVAQQTPPAPSISVQGSDFATTVRVRLTVAPGMVGSNQFTARVERYDSGRPVPARGVRLEFSLQSNPTVASSLTLTRRSPGTWTSRGTNLSINGLWDIRAVVQEATTAVDVPLRLRTRLPPQQTSISRAAGQPTVYTVKLPDGYTLQGYLDPARLGAGVAHFTFFLRSGSEVPVSSARAEAITPHGADQPLKLIPFSKGHYAANLHLTPGRWTFLIHATGPGGRSLSGYYRQTIGH